MFVFRETEKLVKVVFDLPVCGAVEDVITDNKERWPDTSLFDAHSSRHV